MATVKFEDFTDEVKKEMRKAAEAWLEEAAGEVESAVKRESRRNTGKTAGSFRHIVDGAELEATIGSDYQNAIWEEYGTGIYAEKGGRSQVPWTYKAPDGNFYRTSGKRPSRAFRNSYKKLKPKLIKAAQSRFKGL